ncbi:MAG: hypothetical protein LLG05_08620 [Porphyromonadaceae bacterium]|nr:hypothetical protein [Porphyromonadaceae bacterium]
MEKNNILNAIARMAADDNKKLQMSATVTETHTLDKVCGVMFRTDKETAKDASLQALGLPNDNICVAFFIDRKELEKYK